jgi:hypothetical protein
MGAEKIEHAREIIARLKTATGSVSGAELGRKLDLERSTISAWATSGEINFKHVFRKLEHIREEWILHGDGAMLKSDAGSHAKQAQKFEAAGKLLAEAMKILLDNPGDKISAILVAILPGALSLH